MGLLRHDKGRTLDTILHILEDFGYHVAPKVMDAARYDVPQYRKRLIIVAVRKDMDFWFPKERSYTIPLGKALEGCPTSPCGKFSKRIEDIMRLVPEGGNWKNLPTEVQQEVVSESILEQNCATGLFRRLAWGKPSPTLLTRPGQDTALLCHPTELRPISVREYARIQTFPDDWGFEGSVTEQYKQIGNAVPVNLAWHIALAVKESLDGL